MQERRRLMAPVMGGGNQVIPGDQRQHIGFGVRLSGGQFCPFLGRGENQAFGADGEFLPNQAVGHHKVPGQQHRAELAAAAQGDDTGGGRAHLCIGDGNHGAQHSINGHIQRLVYHGALGNIHTHGLQKFGAANQDGLALNFAADAALTMREPLDVVNTSLIPALDVVGKGFEKGTVFLPQLLMSAEAAKEAASCRAWMVSFM